MASATIPKLDRYSLFDRPALDHYCTYSEVIGLLISLDLHLSIWDDCCDKHPTFAAQASKHVADRSLPLSQFAKFYAKPTVGSVQ